MVTAVLIFAAALVICVPLILSGARRFARLQALRSTDPSGVKKADHRAAVRRIVPGVMILTYAAISSIRLAFWPDWISAEATFWGGMATVVLGGIAIHVGNSTFAPPPEREVGPYPPGSIRHDP